jgi:hypothetical protein
MLWQTAIRVVLGLLLATATGLLLGVVPLEIADARVRFDWAATAGLVATGGAVVAAVTCSRCRCSGA